MSMPVCVLVYVCVKRAYGVYVCDRVCVYLCLCVCVFLYVCVFISIIMFLSLCV